MTAMSRDQLRESGLEHAQLFLQQGFRGTTLGPANGGRRLDAAECQAIEKRMRDEGWP
jgi:hypothetical protein